MNNSKTVSNNNIKVELKKFNSTYKKNQAIINNKTISSNLSQNNNVEEYDVSNYDVSNINDTEVGKIDTDGDYNFNPLYNYNTKFGILSVIFRDSDANTGNFFTNLEDWWNGILNFFGVDTPEAKVIETVAENYGYYMDPHQIESITSIVSIGETYVKLNDGTSFILKSNGRINKVYKPDGTRYTYNDDASIASIFKNGFNIEFIEEHDENAKQKVRDYGSINDNVNVKGYARVSGNGLDTKFYWLGSGTKLDTFIENILVYTDAFDKFPPNVKDLLMNYGFNGFYIGTPRDANMSNSYIGNYGYAAFYSPNDKIIFINSDSRQTAFVANHEMGHAIDNAIGKISLSDAVIDLFEKYKITLQDLTGIGYDNTRFPEGFPTSTEFLAEAINQYINNGEELELLIPEIYDYVENLFNSINRSSISN